MKKLLTFVLTKMILFTFLFHFMPRSAEAHEVDYQEIEQGLQAALNNQLVMEDTASKLESKTIKAFRQHQTKVEELLKIENDEAFITKARRYMNKGKLFNGVKLLEGKTATEIREIFQQSLKVENLKGMLQNTNHFMQDAGCALYSVVMSLAVAVIIAGVVGLIGLVFVAVLAAPILPFLIVGGAVGLVLGQIMFWGSDIHC